MLHTSPLFTMNKCFALVFLLIGFTVQAQNPALLPQPVQYVAQAGKFIITPQTLVVYEGIAAKEAAEMLAQRLKRPTGYALKAVPQKLSIYPTSTIYLTTNRLTNSAIGQEGYTIQIKPSQIWIVANSAAGLFYGSQTLCQLLPPAVENRAKTNARWEIACAELSDYPRFGWRGLMLDVSRHFFSVAFVKRYIDQMAKYKFNVFHWHLTDDQGWRIEIKSLPKLTQVGAYRVPRVGDWWSYDPPQTGERASSGGFYTQDEIREVVRYAQQRHVVVVPEIDVPGHSLAAIAAYPELSCVGKAVAVNGGWRFYNVEDNTLNPANEQTYVFLDKVLTEVAALFPSPYIHIGGDECSKKFWRECADVQDFMKKQNLANENQLQSYFIKRVEKILTAKGKKLLGWDEILDGGLAQNATVMSWRGFKGGIEAAKQGRPVIMTPSQHCYLDLYQGDPALEPNTYSRCRLSDSYAFEPVPSGVDEKLILGGQGNLWTESVSHPRHAEYMTWPRGLALAEVLWSPKTAKNWPNFAQRVEIQFARFEAAGVKYAPSMFDPYVLLKKDANDNPQFELKTEVENLNMYYSFDGSNPDAFYPQYFQPLTVPKNATELRVVSYRNGLPIGRQTNWNVADLLKRNR